MKKTALFKRILWVILVAVLMLGAHAAAEEGHQVQLQLLRDGYLPEQKPANMPVLRGETFEEYVLKKIEARETVFDVSDYRMKPEDMSIAFSQLLDGNPRLFFVDGTFWYWHDADGYITDMQIDYVYSETVIAQKLAAFDASVNAIVSYASQADTTLGKIMMVHDYLCVNYEYDNTLEIHSAEEMFRLKTGVCQGYTQCFQAVMNAMGIECKPALSLAMNHVWNMVKVNGSWYHIDVTWDDPVSDMPLRARHQYFMLSDAGMLANEHYDWTSVVSATSQTYDSYFWSDVNNTIPVVGDLMYYVDTQTADLNRTIKAWDLSAGAASNVYTYSIAAADGSYWYYFGYNPIAVGNDWLYYATVDRVYGMPLQGGTPVLMHTASGEDAIFSCWFNGSQLKAYVGESLGNGTVITLDVPAAVPVPYEYTDNGDGTCTITGYTGTDKALEIPAELGGLTVTAIGDSAFEGHNLESVTLPSTLESLGSWAFFFHYDLTEITLPASLTEIGLNPFGGTGLTTIAVDEANTAFKTDGKALYTMDGTVLKFFAAAAEGAYAVPECVTAIEAEAFSAATKVTEVTMPSTLKTIGDYAFSEATGLESVKLNDGLTQIGAVAFLGCTALDGLTLPDDIAEIGNMAFGNNTAPDFTLYVNAGTTTEKTLAAGGWRYELIPLPDFVYSDNGDGTCTITAYQGKDSAVSIPETLDGLTVTGIGAEAFAYCEHVTHIHLPASVRSIDSDAFIPYCGVGAFTVETGNAAFAAVNGVLFSKDKTLLVCYPARKTDREYTVPDTVTEITEKAFFQNYDLETVVLPEDLLIIGAGAFEECSALEKINLPESIEFIGQYAFAGCGSLTATVMQNSYAEEWCMDNGVDTVWPSGESGDGLFTYIIRHDGTASITAYRGNASHVEVPSSINGVRVTMLGIGAFRGSNMSTISLPEGLEVVAMEAFAYCENLQSIHLPSTVRGAALSAFGPYCGAAEITVASGNTNLCSVDGVLFEYGMERLIRYPSGKTDRSYTVPAGVKEIYDGAFEQNYHLEEVVLPEGAAYIDDYAFDSCIALEKITLPESVCLISDHAFVNCSSALTAYVAEGSYAHTWCVENGIDTEIIGSDEVEYTYTDNGDGTCTITGYTGTETDIEIPAELNGLQVTAVGTNAFFGNRSVVHVTIADGIRTIGGSAFFHSSIQSISIPASVTDIGSRAFYAGDLAQITIAQANPVYQTIDGVVFDKTGTTLLIYPIGHAQESYTVPDQVVKIADFAFDGASNLQNIRFSCTSQLEEIGAYALAYLEIEEIVLPAKLRLIHGFAFYNDQQLETVCFLGDAPAIDASSAFGGSAPETRILYYCEGGNGWQPMWNGYTTALFDPQAAHTDVVIEAGVAATCREAGLTEGRYCSACGAVLQIQQIAPVLDHEPVREGCLPATADEDGLKAALGCSICNIVDEEQQVILSSQSVFLPAMIQEVQAEALMGAVMQQVTIPEGVTAIGSKAFAECENLLLVVIPDSVTDIEEEAFENSDHVLLMCSAESYAAQWAEAVGVETVILN